MKKNELKKKVLRFRWEWWAERPFGAFILSLFKEGQTRSYMQKIGVDAQWPAMLFQNGCWYKSEEVWDLFENQLTGYLSDGGSVFQITRGCELYGEHSKKQIQKLIKADMTPRKKLQELHNVLALDIAFVWVTHGLEHLYKKRLYNEIPKYFSGDVEKFIGDASIPAKKNAHYYLEKSLRSKQSLKSVQRRFGWIKARDGFSDPYTIQELAAERKRLIVADPAHIRRIKVPEELKPLVDITKELVYLRTLRTDLLYELLFISRPILKEIANVYGIPFKELRDYSIHDLISAKPRKYPKQVTAISFGKNFFFFDAPILKGDIESIKDLNQLSGTIANRGIAIGKAKIVKTAYEISKVNRGDILLAPTTAPSYIIGMKKAAAFVTDEGGLPLMQRLSLEKRGNRASSEPSTQHISLRTATLSK
ncbi:MAG TPA: PEP-utilizing enzyme [Candidatus Nanoarchaeia archaeon]|nr:PEP-utilizing enzyme [Candidatus Nanoarchaeia archaeon]